VTFGLNFCRVYYRIITECEKTNISECLFVKLCKTFYDKESTDIWNNQNVLFVKIKSSCYEGPEVKNTRTMKRAKNFLGKKCNTNHSHVSCDCSMVLYVTSAFLHRSLLDFFVTFWVFEMLNWHHARFGFFDDEWNNRNSLCSNDTRIIYTNLVNGEKERERERKASW